MQSEFIRNETRPLLIKRRMSLARRLFECVLMHYPRASRLCFRRWKAARCGSFWARLGSTGGACTSGRFASTPSGSTATYRLEYPGLEGFKLQTTRCPGHRLLRGRIRRGPHAFGANHRSATESSKWTRLQLFQTPREFGCWWTVATMSR